MFVLSNLRNSIRKYIGSDSATTCVQNGVRQISISPVAAFNTTPCMMAMPLRKKKRMDPAVIKMKEEKKKKKIEKEIRGLERMKKTLKPIEEARIPISLHNDEEGRRVRKGREADENLLEHDKIDMEAALKLWVKLRSKEAYMEHKDVQKVMKSQLIAMVELRKESVELYNAAIQVDQNFLKFSFKGPSDTPPIKDYIPPDGDYIDQSKNWIEDVRKM